MPAPPTPKHRPRTNRPSAVRRRDPRAFHTTRWSLVARSAGASVSGGSLGRLCEIYWPPIYAHVRRSGHGQQEAEDLTQEFFASLLRYGSIAGVAPGKGRFRSFLLASLRHFLTNAWRRQTALKRGGGKAVLSLDETPGLERDALHLQTCPTPESAFERRWAETVLARANSRLRSEYEAADLGERFEHLKVYLLPGEEPVPYADTATAIGIGMPAVKSAIYKLRQRYGETLRSEIAQTLSDPGEVEDELRHLLGVLSQ